MSVALMLKEAEDAAPNAAIVAASRWYGKLDPKMMKKRFITKRNQTLSTRRQKLIPAKLLHKIMSQSTTLLKKLLKRRKLFIKSQSLLKKLLKNLTRKKLSRPFKSNKIKFLEAFHNNQLDLTLDT
jgi:predicted GNAT family N-acyltransferase